MTTQTTAQALQASALAPADVLETVNMAQAVAADLREKRQNPDLAFDIEVLLTDAQYTIEKLLAAMPAAQEAQLLAFIEKARSFKAMAVRAGFDGPIRWDVEFGPHDDEVRAPTLLQAVAKAMAAHKKQQAKNDAA